MGKDKYGVILDAGSSGTRLYIYKWEDQAHARKHGSNDSLQRMPEIKTNKKWSKKTKPGISTFHDKPNEVGPNHLAPLFEHALNLIPSQDIPHTPLFLLATAGMRLIPETDRKRLLDNICTYARKNTNFLLPDCDLHIQVIPGETEGLYGWIAANYLLGAFDNSKIQGLPSHGNHHTYGFLDMGGASAQIAFAPNSTETMKHADDLKILRLRRLDGQNLEYKVFVTTWLGFGVNEARKRYVQKLVQANVSKGLKELPDPCLPKGLRVNLEGEEIKDVSKLENTEHLIGTGSFSQCETQAYPLLEKEKPCNNVPCLLNGEHAPAIDFDTNHFVGVSEYWHTTHEIFQDKYSEKAYDFATYQKRVMEFCEQDWTNIEKSLSKWKWGKKVDRESASHACFKASWIINVLHDGIGIPRVGVEATTKGTHNGTKEVIAAAKSKEYMESFQPVDKIGDVELSWTLGRMVLYASSQVAPAVKIEAELPVGFGDNVLMADNNPKGFQFGGSGPPMHLDKPIHQFGSNYSYDGSLEDANWHDSMGRDGITAPRRVPGMILFMVIFVFAALLLLGRERRRRLFHAFMRSANIRRRKAPDSGVPVDYERIMEEARSPSFELGSFDDDDGIDPPKSRNYFGPNGSPRQDTFLGGSSGRVGWGPTESRERLGSIPVGWGPKEGRERLGSTTRSRDVSPSRTSARSRSPMPLRH